MLGSILVIITGLKQEMEKLHLNGQIELLLKDMVKQLDFLVKFMKYTRKIIKRLKNVMNNQHYKAIIMRNIALVDYILMEKV